MRFFDYFSNAFEMYCIDHNLDFNKVKACPKCGNESTLFIQRIGSTSTGMKPDNPAEILLSANIDENGNILIKEYEGATKHLQV